MGFRWRPALLLREAFSDLVFGGPMAAFVVTSCLLGGAAIARVNNVDRRDLRQSIASYTEQGGTSFVALVDQNLKGSQLAGITETSCANLSQLDFVVRAGGIAAAHERVFVPSLSGTPVELVRVSPTVFTAGERARLGSASLLLGAQFPQLTQPYVVLAPDGDGVESIPSPQLAGDLGLDRSVVVPGFPPGAFVNKCLITVKLESVGLAAQVIEAQLSTVDAHADVFWLGETLGWHPHDRFAHRNSRFVPMTVGGLLGLLIALWMVSRGSQIASYQVSGTSRKAIVALLAVQGLALAMVTLAAGSIGMMLGGAASAGSGAQTQYAALLVGVGGQAAIASVAATAVPLSSMTTRLRSR